MAADNKVLGRFNLVGIPPAPKGIPQIEVGFDIDANGIVNVTAKDKATGKEQRIQIKSDGGLSPEEIERMKRDSEIHASEDEDRRGSVEARNTAESTVYEIEKNLETFKDNIEPNEKTDIQTKISNVRQAISTNNKTTIEDSVKELQEFSQGIFGEAYKRKSQQQGQQGSSEQKGQNDETVEGDFKDMGDKK